MLPLARFRVLLQDFSVIDNNMSSRDVDLLYVSVTGNGNEMNYEMFVICLFEVAVRKYRTKLKNESKDELFRTLIVS
jgi:hypothetical protein